jgi:hypothetical protein
LQDACGLKSWLEIPQLNSKVVFNFAIHDQYSELDVSVSAQACG